MAIAATPSVLASSYEEKLTLTRNYETLKFSVNNQTNLGLPRCGIQGVYDTATALKVDGVKLTAVCDLYTGSLDRAKEL